MKKYEFQKDFFKSKNVLICGLARSGFEAAKILLKYGANVTVTDLKPELEFKNQIDELKKISSNIIFELGFHNETTFLKQDLIVISPGVPSDLPQLVKAIENNIEVISELEFASRFVDVPYVAITGTNGKTTTTLLTYEILKTSNKFKNVFLGGNIGIAFSSIIENIIPDSVIVLEVSSFQLEFIKYFKPYAATVLNITEDHLNRHKTFEAYVKAKMRIFENQNSNDYAILNFEDKNVINFKNQINSKIITFTANDNSNCNLFVKDNIAYVKDKNNENIIHPIIDTNKIFIKGRHNILNALVAIGICYYGFDIPLEIAAQVLKTFKGAKHRLEFVDEINNIKFYNDSKATNEDSLSVALKAFNDPIILIAGGSDKGSNFEKLALDVKNSNVKTVFVIGEVKEKIKLALNKVGFNNVIIKDTLKDCVINAYEIAKPNDVVLLSPACASLDMFKNYEHRGEEFIKEVNNIKNRC